MADSEGDVSNGHRARSTKPRRPRPPQNAEGEVGALLADLSRHVRRLVRNTSNIAALGLKRLKLRAVDGLLGVAVGLVALAIASVAAIVAAVLVVIGIRDALARWSGAIWVGELGAGVLVLAALFFGMHLLRSKARRKIVEAAPEPDAALDRSKTADGRSEELP